jgi:protein-tyrosine phosphatase
MNAEPAPRVGVLFVCYANVCRSPLAEAVFRRLAADRGVLERFTIDSAGTSALELAAPHPLSVEIAAAHGIEVVGRARQLLRADLWQFHHVLLMDRRNLVDLRRLAGTSTFDPDTGVARIRLLREVVPGAPVGEDLDVPDPVAGGPEAYEHVFGLIRTACTALLDELGR